MFNIKFRPMLTAEKMSCRAKMDIEDLVYLILVTCNATEIKQLSIGLTKVRYHLHDTVAKL